MSNSEFAVLAEKNCMQFSTVLTVVTFVSLADLGFFKGGDFGNPSKRSERALRGSGLTGE